MPATPAAEATHRAHVAARRERSPLWRVIHALGSLKLALLLLATIAIACAVATFAESRFDTKVAQAYIYKAPWFTVWLGVLCLNLFAVTLTRWPWQRKHLGFVITHYGIITLLIGAIIGSHFGFEGNVTLHRGAPPADRITTSRSLLQIQNATTDDFDLAPFDAQLVRPSEARPREFPVPGTDWKIRVDAWADALTTSERLAPAESGPPGVTLDFSSKMMGQHISLPLVLAPDAPAPRDFFGLAKVSLVPDLPARAPLAITESQLVFARFASVTQAEGDVRTGVQAALSSDGAILTVTLADGKSVDFDRVKITGQPQKVGPATITATEYWPDFVFANGKPATASTEPRNPAVLVRVEAPRPLPGARPMLEVAPAADGITYQLGRGDYAISRGAAKVGASFPLGWADWTATLSQSLPHARLVTERRPAGAGENGAPGLRARLVSPAGVAGAPHWLASGDALTLTGDGVTARLGYGLESRPVPFEIGLRNFEVPRLEGTDTPANFIATVEFRDPKTGATKQDVAQMNHPASWPGGAFAVTTGLNYKFSQAQWNPEDLGETTLQVLYDPGWLLKWTGSLAICCGIFIMFYLRPKKS
ncbi:MAG TPA: hypothetical protein VIM61_14645 [Chthoniobacterales bacterium]